MKYKIYFKVNDVQDSIILEGETVDEVKFQIYPEIMKKRGGEPLWCERVGD